MPDPIITFPDDAPCPCESGRSVGHCRCKSRGFVPVQVRTRPGRLVSGMRVAKCYAKATAECRGPISADHAIAESICEDFQRSPITRILTDGTTRTISPGTAGRNVLCQGHNSALSPLDQVGRRFLRVLASGFKHRFENCAEDTHVLFNGFDVERWMLRVLCTMAHNEPASRVHSSRVWRVPRSWLRILFDGQPFPTGAGLYTPRIARGRFDGGLLTAKIVGTRDGTLRSRGLLVDGKDDFTVLGISMSIYGQDFDLQMYPPVGKAELWYRIRMYRIRSAAGGVFHVHLGWDDAAPTFAGTVAAVDRENPKDDLLR